MRRALLLGALSLLIGCGSDDHPENMKPVKPLPEGGRSSGGSRATVAGQAGRISTASLGGSAGTSTSTSSGNTNSAGTLATAGSAGIAGSLTPPPTVLITAPLAIQDPNHPGALSLSTGNDSLNVSCSVTPANESSPINSSSVSIDLEQAGDRATSTISGSAPNFQASFAASQFDTGWVTLSCNASAFNAPTVVGTNSVTTYVDKGPEIAIIEPTESSAHAATKTLNIAAKIVAPATIDPRDTNSAIKSVSVKIAGTSIPTCPNTLTAPDGTYGCEASLNDPTLWGTNLPSGTVSLEITATNLRGTVRTQSTRFLIDQSPPSIVITSPGDEQIVNETGKIFFTVSDADSSIYLPDIRVKIQSRTAGTPIEYRYGTPAERWQCEPKVVDSTKAYDCWFEYLRTDVQYYLSDVLVEVDAADTAGNDTRALGSTQNVDLYLDRIGPYVHLDPPKVRTMSVVSDGYVCSDPFDPVGTWAVGDKQPVGIGLFFRAFVYDTAQVPNDGSFAIMRPALPNPESVYVYVQRDPTVPLLIHKATDMGIYNNDENHPPYCNAINEAAQATMIRLDAVTPWGTPLNTPSNLAGDPVPDPDCKVGTSTNEPLAQCDGPGDLPFVMSHNVSKTSPVIYARRPTNNTEDGCTGDSYQLPLDAQPGWICAVAIARDQARGADDPALAGADNAKGNLGVSPPIRLCFQTDSTKTCDPNNMPSCTKDCTVYDPFSDAPLPYRYMKQLGRNYLPNQ